MDLIENKRRLLAQAVAEEWLCVFNHDPNVPWGTSVEDADGEAASQAGRFGDRLIRYGTGSGWTMANRTPAGPRKRSTSSKTTAKA